MRENRDPISLLTSLYVDRDDTESVLTHVIKSVSLDVLSLRADAMRRRLNSRCEDLLEVAELIATIMEL